MKNILLLIAMLLSCIVSAQEIKDGGLYYIVSAGNGPGYSGGPYNYENQFALYNEGGYVKWKAFDKSESQVYLFTANGDNWDVYNVADGTYINQGTASYSCNVTTSSTAISAQKITQTADGKYAMQSEGAPYVYSLNSTHNGPGNVKASNLNIWGTASEAEKYGVNLWYILPTSMEDVYINMSHHKDLVLGENSSQCELSAFVLTPEGLYNGPLSWSSGDETVATVDNGIVNAVGKGTTTITASVTIDGVTIEGKCEVNVVLDKGSLAMPSVLDLIVVDNDELNQKLLSVMVSTLSGRNDVPLTWETSDESVATVDNGLVKAVGSGNAIITASAIIGEEAVIAECEVNVFSYGESQKVVLVETPGTLPSLISAEEKFEISDLVIWGDVNGADIKFLREMAGSDASGNATAGSLANLDMLHANIVSGGGSYYGSYNTPDNYLGSYMFYKCNSLQNFVAPASIKHMDYYVFQNCSNLRSIILPEGLTNISYNAFNSCTNLQSIIIPSTVSTIGGEAFRGCTSLKTVNIAEDSKLRNLDTYAFYSCSSLEQIFIPQNVTKISNYAFYNCQKLQSVTFAPNCQLQKIDYRAFEYCYALQSISFPETVTNIEYEAFYNCTSLSEVIIPENSEMTFIGHHAFKGTNIESINLPASLVTLSNDAFYWCTNLKTVTIPEEGRLGSIGENAFYNCTNLESVNIPWRTTSIANNAFYNCESLTTLSILENSKLNAIGNNALYNTKVTNLYIPQSVTSIENTGYANNRLKEINVHPSNTAYISVDGVLYNKVENTLITVPKAKTGLYKTPDFLTAIPANAFSGCTVLRSVILTDNIESVDANAFNGCSGLKVIHSLNTTPPTSLTESFAGLNKRSLPVFVPIGSLEAYQATAWNDFTLLAEYSTEPSIWISEKEITLYDTKFDETRYKDLSAVVLTPEGPSDVIITWSTDNDEVATIADGAVSLVAPGAASINVTATVGETPLSATCTVTAIGFEPDQNVYYVKAGQLSSLISEEEKYTMTNLTLFGEINGTDLLYIREMAGSNYYGNGTSGKLNDLDLSEVKIVSGGDAYYYYGHDAYNYSSYPGTGNNTLHHSAFYNCASLSSVKLPKTLVSFEGFMFYDCNNLKSVIFYNDIVTQLPPYMFYGCTKLEEINGVNWADVESIDNYALYSCQNLKMDLDIPNATSIGYYAFFGCSSLKSLSAPSVETIAEHAFFCCRNLKSVEMPSANSIGAYAFSGCTSLESLTAPSVETIAMYAFCNCTNLKSVEIPCVTSIGTYAFNGCTLLKNVELPSSVTSIGDYAFNNASFDNSKIEFVRIKATEVPSLSGTNLIDKDKCVVVVPAASLEDYRNAKNWSSFYQNIIPDDAQMDMTVDVEALSNASALIETVGEEPLLYVTKLKLKGSINSYDFMAFRNKMPNLHYLDLTETTIEANPYQFVSGCYSEVHRLPNQAFKGLTKILDVKLPNSITYVGSYAFDGCSYLRSVDMYQGLTSIGSYAFQNCTSLTSIEVPKGVAGIGSYAFYGCKRLEDIKLNDGLLTIGSYAFRDCDALTEIDIPNSTTEMGSYAFYDCYNLKRVGLPSALRVLNSYTFQSCPKLESAILPARLYSIGGYAFDGCTALTECRIPPMIETIGDYAFRGCNKLTNLYVYIANAQDIKINQNTFSNYTRTNLYIPTFARRSYYYDTQWSQFAKLSEFDDTYDAFYTKNDMLLDEMTGTIDGTPDATLYENSGLILDGVTQDLTEVELKHDGTNGASVIPEGNGVVTAEKAKITIKVGANKWHFFCFPFDVDLTNQQYEGEYLWCRYDGMSRSRRQGGWQNLKEDENILYAGRGYIFQGNKAGNLVLTVEDPEFRATDETTLLNVYPSDNAQDASWNFVGNPYTSYYSIDATSYEAPITVWTGNGYEAYRPGDDDYHFAPYQAFFVQTPNEVTSVDFQAEGCQTYTESKETLAKAKAFRSAQYAKPDRLLINIELSVKGDSTYTDKTRVVFNDKKSLDYELNCDAAKFFSTDRKVELFSVDGKGVQYAINERPVAEGRVDLGIVANEAGTYIIGGGRMDCPVLLIDNELGTQHDLSLGAYEFTSAKGTYANRFTIVLSDELTSIETITEKTGINITVDGGVSVSNIDSSVKTSLHGLNGQTIGTITGEGYIAAPSGVYVLKVGAMSTKIKM